MARTFTAQVAAALDEQYIQFHQYVDATVAEQRFTRDQAVHHLLDHHYTGNGPRSNSDLVHAITERERQQARFMINRAIHILGMSTEELKQHLGEDGRAGSHEFLCSAFLVRDLNVKPETAAVILSKAQDEINAENGAIVA